VLVHALSDRYSLPPAAIAKCNQVFGEYPLAVTHDPADGCRSIVLMEWTAAGGCFFTLTQSREGLFVIRPWNRQNAGGEIGPGEAPEAAIARVIANGMPVPRDGALLGWVPDRQVTALLSVHSGHPPDSGAVVPVPEIQVMPMAGTGGLDWPPFTASPVVDGRLWDYVERGQIMDVVPLLTGSAGQAFLVPRPNGLSPRRGARCVVVTGDLSAEEYWLAAGVYMDHWLLREGVSAPHARQLLAVPGTVDLAATGAVSETAC
jgi:hypothetical protein